MNKNIHDNQQVLQFIEWDQIKNVLDKHSHFDNTLPSLLNPLTKSKIEEKHKLTNVFCNYLLEQLDYDFIFELKSIDSEGTFTQVLFAIEKQRAQSIYEINQLILCAELLFNFKTEFEKLEILNFSNDYMQEFKRKFKKAFLNDFRKFVEKNGDLDYTKHPLLNPLYKEQVQIEQKIRTSISQILTQQEIVNKLQFNSHDVINDHFVIPIKSNSYETKIGQIISRSESGHTLFVEPKSISNLNQRRIELLIKISEVISKLELELIQKLEPFNNELINIKDSILILDEFLTRSNFALDLGLINPKLTDEPQINLKDAFHPLIKDPVKNDLLIERNKKGLIISGPNTGGKTATLKTLALTQLFLRFGFFIPAGKAQIHLYDKVFYFGHDQQNLEDGLSSFAAEVKNYMELFEELGDSNLILIDEIFNSTSSEEASALAISLFEKLENASQNHLIVSTHHQTLKTLMHENTEYLSGHVGFDLENNSPTYKINIGTPGSSYALNIFQKLTGDDSFFAQASSVLDNKAIHYEKLLQSLSTKENELNRLLDENKDLNNQLNNQKSAMQGVIKLKTQEAITKVNSKLDIILADANKVLKEVKNKNLKNENQLHNKFSSLKKKSKESAPFKDDSKELSNLIKPTEYIEGKIYFSSVMNKDVELVKINQKRNQATVKVGNLTMHSSLDKLYQSKSGKKQSKTVKINIEKETHTKMSYDCRGMRLSEFKSLIEKCTSPVLIGELPYIEIIHGHGTGVLKKWLRDFIKVNADLKIEESEDGNDGSSRIVLK